MRPDDDYLIAVGWANYTFQYLEWGVIWVLSKLTGGDVVKVETKTPRQIAKELYEASEGYPITHAWAHDFLEFIPLREHLVHSRPATTDNGEQRLYRHEIIRPHGGTFFLDSDWLNRFTESAHKLSLRYYEALEEVELESNDD